MVTEEAPPFIITDPIMVRDDSIHPWMNAVVTGISYRPGRRNFGRNWVVTARTETGTTVVVVVDHTGRCFYNGALTVQGGVEE